MRWLLRTLVVLVLLAAALVAFVIGTESGLQLAWRQLGGLLPVHVNIESVEGRLVGPVTVHGFTFEDATQRVDIERLRLEWQPRRLMRGLLHINRLAAEGIVYEALAAPAQGPPDTPFSLPQDIGVPLRVNVDHLELNHIRYLAWQAERAIHIDRVQAAAQLDSEQLRLVKLDIAAPDLAFAASGHIGTGGDYPLAADARWRLSLPDLPQLSGHTRAGGSLRRLVLEQSLDAPYAAQAKVELRELFATPRFDAALSFTGLDLQALQADSPALVLDGEIAGHGSFAEPAINATLRLNETGTVNLDAQLRGEQIDALLEWRDLRWPGDADAVHSDSGRLDVTGTLDDYRLNMEGAIDTPVLRFSRVELAGQGDRHALRIDALTLGMLDGEVRGTARIGWDPRISAEVDLHGTQLNPGLLWEGWHGRLALHLQGSGEVQQDGIAVHVARLAADGTLREYPLQLDARGGYADDRVAIDAFSLRSGATRVTASGAVGDTLALDWQLHSSDLESLLPAASGQLEASGIARGALQTPRIEVRGQGSDLRYQDYWLHSLAVDASVDISGSTRSVLDLQRGKGDLAGTRLEHLSLQGSGTPDAHVLDLDATLGQGELHAAVSGSLGEQRWTFRADSATVAWAALDPWTLQPPMTGSVGAQQGRIDNSCWRSGPASLCLGGSWRADASDAELTLQDLPLAWLQPLLPAGIELQGEIDATGRLAQRDGGQAEAQLRITSSAGRLLGPAPDEDADSGSHVELLAFRPGELRLDSDARGLSLALALPLERQGQISLDASVAPGDAPLAQRPLRGRVQTELRDLSFISELVPQLSRVSGRLEGDTRLSGTLARPRVEGDLALVDGAAMLDAPNLRLTDLEMQLSGRADGRVDLRLSAASGDGRLVIAGETGLAPRDFAARLSVTGEDFRLLDIAEAQVDVSPDLTISIDGRKVDIDGEIRVPRATLEPRQLSESAVGVSGDQVLVDDIGDETATERYRISSRIRLVLGDQVRFDGFGLTGRLSGNVMTRDEPMKPTTASGEIRIHDGRYLAYGQNLNIRSGRLLFVGGPVAEPGIDVEAVRTPAPDILVGVKVRGQLKQPDISLFSEPDMSQTDRIAWLVLGRPLESESTAEERSTVNQAALALGMGGGALLGKRVGEKIGVDELTIESEPTEDTEQAALLVGKYLTPKLFISYGVGLFEPVSTLRLRYTISSRWKLVGETSATTSGADLFYIIERGK